MRPIYAVWAAGLLLKFTGAAWDVAWHFRLLREAISPPHMVNLLGEALVAAAFLYEWRHRVAHRRVPLLIVLAGGILFAFAIPFDQFWHAYFGIDITTWSPAHLLLFGGTAVLVAGITLLFLADLRHERGLIGGVRRASYVERGMLAFFVIGLAEAVAFPLAYNEYTALAVRDAVADPGRLDPVIINMALLVPDPVFHGTPHWLYPVYSIVMMVLLATIVRAAIGPGWAAVMLIGVAALRAVSNAILYGLGWPDSVVPWQHVGVGVAVELAWLVPLAGDRWRAMLGGAAGATAAYLYFQFPPEAVDVIPLDASSAFVGIPLAILVALGGYALQERAPALMARVPVMNWERYADRVAQWSPRRT